MSEQHETARSRGTDPRRCARTRIRARQPRIPGPRYRRRPRPRPWSTSTSWREGLEGVDVVPDGERDVDVVVAVEQLVPSVGVLGVGVARVEVEHDDNCGFVRPFGFLPCAALPSEGLLLLRRSSGPLLLSSRKETNHPNFLQFGLFFEKNS